MINRYSFSDPIILESTEYTSLNVEMNNSGILKIFRLLSGTINCKDQYSDIDYQFRTNYLCLPFTQNSSISESNLTDAFSEEIELTDLNGYFNTMRRNASFYNSIQTEITKCLIANSKENYLEAFFYLYRILEGISYTLPLIYTSRATDYQKSYKQLKSFFSNNSKDGELAFFKKFVVEIFKEEDFFTASIDVDLNSIEIEELKAKYYSIYKTICDDKHLSDSTDGEELNFRFIGYYEFLLEIRNRYFHFLQGSWKKNIASSEVLFPDIFFKPLINHGVNWVSTIIFEIIKYDISN